MMAKRAQDGTPFLSIPTDASHPQREAEQTIQPAPRISLTEWAESALSPQGYTPAAHHRLLIQELELIAGGQTDRLMLLLPPGSAKSTYASILFPVWWFTRHPRSSIIAASHTADLAQHFGRQVRDHVAEYHDLLGYGLVSDNRAAGRWRISTGGDYYAAGVRGPITGRRADLAIIDDPVKSHAEADSAVFRDLVWNWYRSDLVTRLKPRGRIVLIMTRWHQDDLGGRLLAHQRGEWRVLRLPALAEADDPLHRAPGTPLWPEWEDAAALARKRATVGERVWAAMYQQSPRPADGALFNVRLIAMLDTAPASPPGRTVRAWDLAATAKRDGNDPDWTVGLKLQRDENNRFTVLDLIRLRGGPHEVEAAILHAAKLDGRAVAISLPKDPGSAGGFVASYLAGQLAGHKVIISTESGSKLARATPAAAQIEAGNVALVRAAWNHAFIEELSDFPHGAKDDQVDALSRAFAALTDTTLPSRRMSVPFVAR
jgi:predicted phage terminase large subunit-like protein